MLRGSFTAIITPFKDGGVDVDYQGLDRLVAYQIESGITGILAVGTTGESPTLSWREHNKVIEAVAKGTVGPTKCIAGTGSNNTTETLEASRHAAKVGADAVLLVDPYYNGPSSLEIRREYVEPVANAVPDLEVIPYVIPGRTGAQLLPEDLGIMNRSLGNMNTVKEATGDIENMRRTRECCGPDFTILSGDDAMTFEMMTDPRVKAAGVISVASNVIPGAVAEMVRLLDDGDEDQARRLLAKIEPLFSLVTVKTTESCAYGDILFRARNPLAYKTLMSVLGMPSGGCRQPLGKLTEKALGVVLEAARQVQTTAPEILRPVSDFFGVDIEDRLSNPTCWEGLTYSGY